MTDNAFFDESSDQSEVKRTIVSKYFDAWAGVIIPHAKRQSKRIAYIDLFAGPGRYLDGTKSTPILILEKAISHPDMRTMLVTLFNDKNSDHSQSLEKAIKEIKGIELLKYYPMVKNNEVGEDIVKEFSKMKLVPTLFFIDPWGYKGLSLKLVNSVLKDWGCDCIFFFNYNRINMGLPNDIVREHMNALFEEERAETLRVKLLALEPEQRELTIIEELSNALIQYGGKYVLPFRFRNDAGTRTSHYIFFVSKSFRGYGIMKDIMAKESSTFDQGVASFEYCSADERQPLLFSFFRPLDQLEELLLTEYSGRTLSLNEIYVQHSVGRQYISKNYKEVLISMEKRGVIVADPPQDCRRKMNGEPTFADHVKVTFPERKNG
jgi:three-Cys-motif partner protein